MVFRNQLGQQIRSVETERVCRSSDSKQLIRSMTDQKLTAASPALWLKRQQRPIMQSTELWKGASRNGLQWQSGGDTREHRTFHNRRQMNGADELQGGQNCGTLKPRRQAPRRTTHVKSGQATMLLASCISRLSPVRRTAVTINLEIMESLRRHRP